MNDLYLVLAFVLAGWNVQAQVVDITRYGGSGKGRESILFKAEQVLLVEALTGQRAVVQFTRLTARGGAYRWRYQQSPETAVLSGRGEVAEKYERIPDGSKVRLVPLSGHDTSVRAGDIRAEWSMHDSESGFFYFHSKQARVRVLPPACFEMALDGRPTTGCN